MTFSDQAHQLDAKVADARADAADLRRRADQLEREADQDEAAARSLRQQGERYG